MQTTNRFNYYNRLPTLDSEETLLSLFARVSSRTIGPDIEWVANNPWEKPYAQVKYSSTRALNYTQVIRPFGHFNHESATLHREAPASKNSVGVSSSVSSNNSTSNQKISVSTSSSNSSGDIVVSPHDAQFAVVRNEGLNHGFYDLLVANNVPVLPIKQKYGGPTVLAQYKAFIELPYQVSTMKVRECSH